MSFDFKNPWGKGSWEYDKWFGVNGTALDGAVVQNNSAVTPEAIARAAERLGSNQLMMDSYRQFQEGAFSWFFSKNPNLVGKYTNVSELKNWNEWRSLNTQQKEVIGNLAGVDLNALAETNTNLEKLVNAHKRWPIGIYAIFWGSEFGGGTWTCNIFVGESLYLAGKNTVNGDGKYYSAMQIHNNGGPFKAVAAKDLKRGHIVTMHDGSHTEIVTKTPLKFLLADDGFCSIGGGRSLDEMGVVKCDSSSTFSGDREINNSNNKYHSV
ncbi:MAG: hypothetical protein KBG24_09090 [Bacteroidia bacterium]|nr:hypothetical protein [Bacteroidia bacterium]MBP9180636.1 hypothetical protein [Bacteroidia bacterium]MBP9724974.1 hypothetical protein [Bacteroidia bacterium]